MEGYGSMETFGFSMDVLGSTKITTTVIKLVMTYLQRILTPLFVTIDIISLVIPYLFYV